MAKSALRYIGGKDNLTNFIIPMMPPHTMYVEVFTGSAIVFLEKPLAKNNVLNDFNGNLINLYKVMQNEEQYKALQILLTEVPYGREYFDTFLGYYRNPDTWFQLNPVYRAFVYLYMNKTSFNGQFLNYARREDSANFYEIEPLVKGMHKKFRAGKAVFEKLSFENLLQRDGKLIFDNKETFLYLDPPYWVTTQPGNSYYEKLMSVSEHKLLAEMMMSHKKAKWLMSYDNLPEVRKLYNLPKQNEQHTVKSEDGKVFACLTQELYQSSASLSKEQVSKQEILIANYNIGTVGSLFDE